MYYEYHVQSNTCRRQVALTCSLIAVGAVFPRIVTSHAGVWSVALDDDTAFIRGAVETTFKH